MSLINTPASAGERNFASSFITSRICRSAARFIRLNRPESEAIAHVATFGNLNERQRNCESEIGQGGGIACPNDRRLERAEDHLANRSRTRSRFALIRVNGLLCANTITEQKGIFHK